MKTRQILSVLAILFFHNIYAQNYCGFDAIKEHSCKDEHFQNQVKESDKKRRSDCKIVRRKGKVYIINKKNPRFKQRQG